MSAETLYFFATSNPFLPFSCQKDDYFQRHSKGFSHLKS